MPRSFLRRAWDAVKPPPAPPARRRLNRAQRRLIRGTVTVIALGLTAWGVFAYIAAAPERALSHYQQGMNLLGAGDFQNAVSQFTRALAIMPDYADAYVGRGKALQATGQNNAAAADFERALAANPSLDAAYTSHGVIQRSRGDSPEALADFTRSLRLRPSPDAYYQRGLTYQMLGQPDKAAADYDLAILLDKDAPHIHRARAKARRELGDRAGAREDDEAAERVEQTQ